MQKGGMKRQLHSRLQGRNLAGTAPIDGQVIKFNSATGQWEPGTDNTSSGGGGTITGVTPGTGLTGGGASGNVTLNIANSGVGTTQIADNNVTDAKINSVSGSKVTGTVANAANATNAVNASNATTAVTANSAANATNATNAVNATNATNAATAMNFSGSLGGDVTGNQTATTVARLRDVSLPAPVVADNGKVLKYKNNGVDPITLEWATDNTAAGGGVTTVTASGPLVSSGGATPNISLTGVVPSANGGTGLSASGTSGNLLRSSGTAWTSAALQAVDVPTGRDNYIQNRAATPQVGGNFNISGDGSIGQNFAVGGFARIFGAATITGNVGIGTPVPLCSLDVRGNVFVGLTASPTSLGQNALYLANDGGTPSNDFRVDAANNFLYIIGRSNPGGQLRCRYYIPDRSAGRRRARPCFY